MRWTPIRPLWQDLAYHASKALPALLLYGWLAWRIGGPIVRRWQGGRFYLWSFTLGLLQSPRSEHPREAPRARRVGGMRHSSIKSSDNATALLFTPAAGVER
jgi:hypothetical protein